MSLIVFRPQATTRDFVVWTRLTAWPDLAAQQRDPSLACVRTQCSTCICRCIHAVQRLAAARAGIVWEAQAACAPRKWRLRNQNPALIFVLTASEELGQRRLLSDCGCGPMNLSTCPALWRAWECGARRARQDSEQASNKLCAQAYVQEAKVVNRRLSKCKAQAVVLRLVRDAVPNHRTGISEGVCLGRARRMWMWWLVRLLERLLCCMLRLLQHSIIKQRHVIYSAQVARE